jgi:plasmid stabilization system protein ParE
LALPVRVEPRAFGEIRRAAQWWSENRPAAPDAAEADLRDALASWVWPRGIGPRVDESRDPDTRRFLLDRTRCVVCYRLTGPFLEGLDFWHASREHEPRV